MTEQSVLEKLRAGARKFHSEVYSANIEQYKRAASVPQTPHALVISCADSRVDIEAITSSGPGDIFVTRNVGNMVPPYSGTPGGVTAVIEYAVAALKVNHVAVCGHSDCGAMKALLDHATTDDEPHIEKLKRLTEENVLMQLVHLKTHPSVAGAMARGELTLSGWVYDIGTGIVRIAEEGRREFTPVVVLAGARE